MRAAEGKYPVFLKGVCMRKYGSIVIKMRILMVHCNTPQDNTVPIGITQVIACLRVVGHEAALFDTTFYDQGFTSSAELRITALHFKPVELEYAKTDMYDDFKKKIAEFKPDIIGFSVFEVTFRLFTKMLESVMPIVREKKIKIAVGGVQALFWPETFAKNLNVDFIAISEAEITFPELCRKIELGENTFTQAGFWVREGEKWHKNPASSLIDLNSLPLARQDDFDESFRMKPMMGRHYKTVTVELSRGCPYKCTYCADAFLSEQFKDLGKWHRQKTVAKLEEEYSSLINQYKPEFIYKFSETFFAGGKQWTNDYREMYKKYLLPFWTQSRPETINEDNVKVLADLNCLRFSVGLESGNEEFRKKTLLRGYSDKKVLEAGKILKKYNINFSMNLIVGYPFETRDMIFDGVRLLREIKPNGISTFIYTPYKGSKLRRVCEENNMIDPDLICDDYFQMKYELRNNTFGEKEILGLYRVLLLYIYLPESRYPEIKKAEAMTPEGDAIFDSLRHEYYDIMGWN
jgi:anaerobic magnesium-protoporphyrin IX monomethyl ester cyclase